MQLRVRHPAGQAVLTLDDSTATVALLFTSIAQTCALDVSCISLMSGFPPATLNVAHDSSASLKDIGLQSGDTLIVKAKQADMNVTPTPVGVGGAGGGVVAGSGQYSEKPHVAQLTACLVQKPPLAQYRQLEHSEAARSAQQPQPGDAAAACGVAATAAAGGVAQASHVAHDCLLHVCSLHHGSQTTAADGGVYAV